MGSSSWAIVSGTPDGNVGMLYSKGVFEKENVPNGIRRHLSFYDEKYGLFVVFGSILANGTSTLRSHQITQRILEAGNLWVFNMTSREWNMYWDTSDTGLDNGGPGPRARAHFAYDPVNRTAFFFSGIGRAFL